MILQPFIIKKEMKKGLYRPLFMVSIRITRSLIIGISIVTIALEDKNRIAHQHIIYDDYS
ncbi:hypothetical protein GCM10022378_01730 [Salinicoccus jeotgali]|uniref:Uncharacterized protein n=1 Tax=Salinicoccus jeotgali TaxID=381634 RepID=A0ABP7E5T6_9STAP